MRYDIDVFSFSEFIEYGKNKGANIVNGMPWHFKIYGYPVTHENDELYLIITPKETLRFTPKHFLLFDLSNGDVSVNLVPSISEDLMKRLSLAIWGDEPKGEGR